jgi:tetratricopeptide (TPR) repeat protein
MAHASIGTAYILAGKGEKAIPPLKTAMRLNPVDLNCFHTLGELAIAHMMIGETKECLDYSEQSLGLRPGYWYSRLTCITALVESGQVEDARREISELKNHNPNFTLDDIRWLPFVDVRWNNRLIDGLSRAGFSNEGS